MTKKFTRRQWSKSYDSVAIVGLSGGGLDAQIMHGFNRFRRTGLPWVLDECGHMRQYLGRVLESPENYTGVVANVTDAGLADQLLQTGLPVIDLSGFIEDAALARVTTDSHQVGAFAAMHFMERGFVHFAFVSNASYPHENQRWAGFRDRLLSEGHKAEWFILEGRVRIEADGNESRFDRWLHELERLPRPLAVFTASDRVGMNLCDACRVLNIPVPEQIAVLGVDDNAFLCESCEPPLSSVALAGEKIGYEAGRILRNLIDGKLKMPLHRRFAPIGVVTRKSTEITAIDDAPIAQSLNMMREQAMKRISVGEIARAVGLDRRTFYRRFEKAIGRTPLEEMYRLRVELAKHSLAKTTKSVYQIAMECGFGDADRFNRHFKQHEAMTPSEYRRRFSLQ